MASMSPPPSEWQDLDDDGLLELLQERGISVDALEATDSVTANGTTYLGNFATEADLPDPSNVPVGAEATVESDPNGQTSVYKLVDE